MFRAIIVDDEPGAREKLALMLTENHADSVTVLAVCRDGEEALQAIAGHKPDLVFLDVEMPRISGFDVLRRSTGHKFDVVFTTAYDHYAIKAIQFAAIDYLLKPIDIETLGDAIKRVKERRGMSGAAGRVDQLIEDHQKGGQPGRISVPSQEGFVVVSTADIIWCEAVNYYTVLHLAGNKQLVATRTLKEFEEMLEGGDFFRIHRGHMINLKHMARYIKGAGGQVVMSDGKTLDVARPKKDELMARMGR